MPVELIVANPSPSLGRVPLYDLLYTVFIEHWYVWLFVIVASLPANILKSPRVRGSLEEMEVRVTLSALKRNDYEVLNDVLLCQEDGS